MPVTKYGMSLVVSVLLTVTCIVLIILMAAYDLFDNLILPFIITAVIAMLTWLNTYLLWKDQPLKKAESKINTRKDGAHESLLSDYYEYLGAGPDDENEWKPPAGTNYILPSGKVISSPHAPMGKLPSAPEPKRYEELPKSQYDNQPSKLYQKAPYTGSGLGDPLPPRPTEKGIIYDTLPSNPDTQKITNNNVESKLKTVLEQDGRTETQPAYSSSTLTTSAAQRLAGVNYSAALDESPTDKEWDDVLTQMRANKSK